MIRRTASTRIIFITVFLDLLGFGMVLPLLPLYANDPRFHATPTEIGWLMAIYSLMQFLFTPIWGKLSDKIGRRPVIIIGLFGSSISYLVYGLSNSLALLFVSRAMAGIMGANIAAAQAAMADLTPPEHRMRAMGMIGAAFGMGFVLGPAIGGMLSIYGMETAPLAAAVLTGLNGIAAFFLLAETMHTPMFMPVHHPLSWQLWFKVRRVPAAMAVCILMGLFVLFFSGFEVTLPLWGAEYLHWSMTSAGWTFAYVGVIMVIVQGVVIRRLTGRLGEKKAAQIGLLSTAFGLVLLPLADMLSPHAIYLPLGMVAVGAGLVHPSLSSLVSINTESYRQGLMMGLFQSMSALGRVLGPVAAGLAYSVWHKMIFLVIGLAILIVTVSFFTVCQRVQDAQHQ